MHAIHNARITLAATAFNNLGVAVIIAGILAPLVKGEIDTPASVAIWSIVGVGFVGLAQATLGRLL
jgi:uncharacterized membrane protein (DUF441 family)